MLLGRRRERIFCHDISERENREGVIKVIDRFRRCFYREIEKCCKLLYVLYTQNKEREREKFDEFLINYRQVLTRSQFFRAYWKLEDSVEEKYSSNEEDSGGSGKWI